MKKFEKDKQAGMLLIEVLLSILIFSFGLLGLVGLQAISSKNAAGAEDRTIAASLANDMVAIMWIRKSVDVTTDPLKTDFTNWQAKVTSSLKSSSSNVSSTTATPTIPAITTVTINWSAPATSGGSSTAIAHQYSTQFSM